MGTAGLVIDPRFNGPPDSGHGGYCAGRAAALVAAPAAAVEVTLRRPVPLATALRAEPGDGGGVALSAGVELIMIARPAPAPALRREPAIGVEAAQAAADPGRWGDEHPFPTCFGCGPDRDPADALRLFAGRAGDDRFAVAWTPADWAGRDGVAAPEFVWAAVDCPSASPAAGGDPVVLGRLTLAVDGPPVPLGRPAVVESWSESVEGRKHHTAVVLHDGAGTVYARGRAVWIAVPR